MYTPLLARALTGMYMYIYIHIHTHAHKHARSTRVCIPLVRKYVCNFGQGVPFWTRSLDHSTLYEGTRYIYIFMGVSKTVQKYAPSSDRSFVEITTLCHQFERAC